MAVLTGVVGSGWLPAAHSRSFPGAARCLPSGLVTTKGRRWLDNRFCPRTEVVKQLLHRLLADQQRHEVPDRSVVEVGPEALNQDLHLIDRHRWELEV